jgi:steroid 5-alpha reductase family enzyme
MLHLLLVALVAMVLVMALVWVLAVRIRNASIVDIAWTANFSLLALVYAALGSGALRRRLLIAAMTVVWSARLAGYLYVRIRRHHPAEDPRYVQLRKEWAPHADRRFFFFFELQGLSNVILSAPVRVATLNPRPGITALEWAGVALWAVALAGEGTADRQLDRFRQDPANRGHTCRTGLWRYSRHPNYFFEWLVWVAYFLFAAASPWGWLTVYCPLLMLYFLFRVTGIPRTEAQALESRGGEYRDYQRTTSVFVPWFPKTPRQAASA